MNDRQLTNVPRVLVSLPELSSEVQGMASGSNGKKGKGKKREHFEHYGYTPYQRLPPPSGVTPPMCLCGDPCRVVKSAGDATFGMRLWKCNNYVCDVTAEIRRRFPDMSPDSLCEFKQWIDTEMTPENKSFMDYLERDKVRSQARFQARMREEEEQRERQLREEERRRLEAEAREAERERKRERARRAREASAGAWEKGKWPRCTQ